jgi:hypothetical protein
VDVKITPKGTNMIGYYRECEEPDGMIRNRLEK